jgi:hypothetical protein
MDYRKTFEAKSPRDVIKRLRDSLLHVGFTEEERDEYRIRLAGPRMLNTGKNPLSGIKSLELRADGTGLEVVAEINRVIRLFVMILGIVSGVLIVVGTVASVLQAQVEPVFVQGMWALIIGGNILVWACLLPVIGLVFKRQAIRVLESVMEEHL